MNIFAVDACPERAAQMLCDKHVVKMPLESAQMLCTVLTYYNVEDVPYRPCHRHHPCTIWARTTQANYDWLTQHGRALCAEYTRRYGRIHKSQAVIEHCALWRHVIPAGKRTPFVQAMPEETRGTDPHVAYQNYYNKHKAHFAVWKKREPPMWFSPPEK